MPIQAEVLQRVVSKPNLDYCEWVFFDDGDYGTYVINKIRKTSNGNITLLHITPGASFEDLGHNKFKIDPADIKSFFFSPISFSYEFSLTVLRFLPVHQSNGINRKR